MRAAHQCVGLQKIEAADGTVRNKKSGAAAFCRRFGVIEKVGIRPGTDGRRDEVRFFEDGFCGGSDGAAPCKFHDVIGVEREEFLKRCCGTATEIFGKRAAGVGRAAISTDERHTPVKHVVEILSKDAGECSAS